MFRKVPLSFSRLLWGTAETSLASSCDVQSSLYTNSANLPVLLTSRPYLPSGQNSVHPAQAWRSEITCIVYDSFMNGEISLEQSAGCFRSRPCAARELAAKPNSIAALSLICITIFTAGCRNLSGHLLSTPPHTTTTTPQPSQS
jgi:hypothetical protein